MLTLEKCWDQNNADKRTMLVLGKCRHSNAGTLIRSNALKGSVQSPTIRGDGEGKKPKPDEPEYEEAPSSEIGKPHNVCVRGWV
jgi:hypothetical protein